VELQIFDQQRGGPTPEQRKQLLRERHRSELQNRPDLKIPQMKSGCQIQPFGSKWLPSCR
jgi:hypothetical protein